MRRLREMVAMAILSLTVVGVAGLRGIDKSLADPLERTKEMLVTSESIGQARNRCWHTRVIEAPTHLTYERVHGGIGP